MLKLKIALLQVLVSVVFSTCSGGSVFFDSYLRKRSIYDVSLDNLKEKIREKKSREHYKSILQPCPKDECNDSSTDKELDKDIAILKEETQEAKKEYFEDIGKDCTPKDCSDPDIF